MRAVLQFLGGISFFLYGMIVMSKSLKSLSGERLSAFLARACCTPLRGVILGALVTAAIQSSSATTVMVVGFVNAGLMQLPHAVGVIMGANLGTTVTAWILSLSGISGGAPLLLLLKPQSLSPLLATVGVALLLFGKQEKLQHLGSGLAGFGILFAGMEAMSDAVQPLAENPQFASLLTLFENPIAGIFAGAVLTAILQSSSASVGILQALCATGAVRLSLAVGVVMGQNVGTCVTALVSSVGSDRNARRAAFVHLYFNVAGTALLLPVFFGLRALGLLSGAAFVSEGDVALIHTLFNVFTTLALLPFHRLLLRAAQRTVV
ncbi:MAG: Na/Pi cotransporter family protein [Clostridia bacterium]|nr:Na/Pi cotransporter family protein [Clostridia bacterium]